MNTQLRYAALSLVIFSALMLSAVNPTPAWADGGTPPVSPAPSANSGAPSRLKHANDLSDVPAGTKVAVLDAMGNKVPLGSQAAADIIAASDPIWCPSGDLPDNVNCTAGYATVALLITNLATKSGPGIIYFTSTYATNDATFNHNNSHLLNLTDLTMQGGWNGSTSSPVISGVTTFSVPVTVKNWIGDVTINEIVIDSTSSTGLTVKTHGNIQLTDVRSDNNSGNGALLDNTGGTGTVTVDDSTGGEFSSNGSVGLKVYSNGDITLTAVSADENSDAGAYLDNTSSLTAATVTVDNSTGGEFNTNGQAGLRVYSDGAITLTAVVADENGDAGAHLDNTSGTDTVTVDNSLGGEFNANGGAGLRVFSSGAITLTDVTADNNSNNGAHLDNTYSTTAATVTVDDSTFGDSAITGNGLNGLKVYSNGAITLTDVTADSNGTDGAYLDNSGSGGHGSIAVSSSIFDDNIGNSVTGNGGRGLIAHSNDDIALADVTASGNALGGAELDNTTGSGGILLSGNNIFNDNGFNLSPSVGLYAVSNNDIGLDGVTALGNGYGAGGGAYIGTILGDISITHSVFSGNCTDCGLGVGFVAFGGGDILVQNVTADGNGNDPANGYTGSALAIGGLIFDGGGNVTVLDSKFDGNCTLGDCAGGGLAVEDEWTGSLISLDHVNANGNGIAGDGAGADIASAGNVNVNCSTFNQNASFGLEANLLSGNTITLSGVTASGNSVGPTDITGGTLVSNPGCRSSSSSLVVVPVGLSLNVINVPDGGDQGHGLDCTQYSGTELVLPNGDLVLLPCPIGNNAALAHVADNKLPGTLESNFNFVSAMDAEVTPSLDGTATVSFKIPAGQEGSKFAILHWDGTKWDDLGGSLGPAGYFSVNTNLTGDFVLVSQ